MTLSRLLTLALLYVALILAVNAASVARAQDDTCAAFTSVSVRGSGVRLHSEDADVLDSIAAWEFDTSRWQEAVGRPEYTLYLQTDGSKEGRRYLLVYPSRADAESVVVFAYSWERLFGDHADSDLHNHPNCSSGALPRSNIDTLLAALSS